jgi:hypothetical protein
MLGHTTCPTRGCRWTNPPLAPNPLTLRSGPADGDRGLLRPGPRHPRERQPGESTAPRLSLGRPTAAAPQRWEPSCSCRHRLTSTLLTLPAPPCPQTLLKLVAKVPDAALRASVHAYLDLLSSSVQRPRGTSVPAPAPIPPPPTASLASVRLADDGGGVAERAAPNGGGGGGGDGGGGGVHSPPSKKFLALSRYL